MIGWAYEVKVKIGQDSEARFGQDFKFSLDSETEICSRFV